VRFSVIEPKQHRGHSLTGRIYCTPKALWRLSWFLRDFGYNTDLLGRDELDEKALLGLQGIVRVSHTILNGHSFLNLRRIRSCCGLGRVCSGNESGSWP